MIRDQDIIVAPATPAGGAIAVVRLSGKDAPGLCDRFFRGSAPLADAAGYTLRYGRIFDGPREIDDVLVSVFRAPRSYTGEDSVEISCHGSSYIVSEILRLAQAAGARMAEPGEFTVRAYLAGKLDLSQAEAVADLIASSSQAAHTLAVNQMRGSVRQKLEAMQEKLLRLASLLELELDFGEEEVEFADRSELCDTMSQIRDEIDSMRNSFSLGNALKEGVPVVIAGAPNVGKSTLLNRLSGDDRALVSDIAGTTRDVIEEQANIGGVLFRFLDTAGIRSTDDRLEQLGIERTHAAIGRARIVIRMIDAREIAGSGRPGAFPDGSAIPAPDFTLRSGQTLLTVINKIDAVPGFSFDALCPAHRSEASSPASGDSLPGDPKDSRSDSDDSRPSAPDSRLTSDRSGQTPAGAAPAPFSNSGNSAAAPSASGNIFAISARDGIGIDALCRALRDCIDTSALFHGDVILSNSRHFQALSDARNALDRAFSGIRSGLSSELLAEEIREVIRTISAISGRNSITPDDILHNIFSKFCIGK